MSKKSSPKSSAWIETIGDVGESGHIGRYTREGEIGKGSFATVYSGFERNTGESVAVKSVIRSKLTNKLLTNLELEISILKRLSHPNIVELKECYKETGYVHLVMTYCTAGDLAHYLKQRGAVEALDDCHRGFVADRIEPYDPAKKVSTPANPVLYPHPPEGGLNTMVVRCFLGQIADAFLFLRQNDIVHRDIKPQNLLLTAATHSDIEEKLPLGVPVLKIADFGFARSLLQTNLAETLCGSPLYMAPEILRYEKYGVKVDLWSIGAVLYEISTSKQPFRAQNHIELLRRIERRDDQIVFPDERMPKPDRPPAPKVPEDIKFLIRALLRQRPDNRIDAESFVKLAAKAATAHDCLATSFPRLAAASSANRARATTARPQLPRRDIRDLRDSREREARERELRERDTARTEPTPASSLNPSTATTPRNTTPRALTPQHSTSLEKKAAQSQHSFSVAHEDLQHALTEPFAQRSDARDEDDFVVVDKKSVDDLQRRTKKRDFYRPFASLARRASNAVASRDPQLISSAAGSVAPALYSKSVRSRERSSSKDGAPSLERQLSRGAASKEFHASSDKSDASLKKASPTSGAIPGVSPKVGSINPDASPTGGSPKLSASLKQSLKLNASPNAVGSADARIIGSSPSSQKSMQVPHGISPPSHKMEPSSEQPKGQLSGQLMGRANQTQIAPNYDAPFAIARASSFSSHSSGSPSSPSSLTYAPVLSVRNPSGRITSGSGSSSSFMRHPNYYAAMAQAQSWSSRNNGQSASSRVGYSPSSRITYSSSSPMSGFLSTSPMTPLNLGAEPGLRWRNSMSSSMMSMSASSMISKSLSLSSLRWLGSPSHGVYLRPPAKSKTAHLGRLSDLSNKAQIILDAFDAVFVEIANKPNDAAKAVRAAEALALCLESLACLADAIQVARASWLANVSKPVDPEFVSLVQWLRRRFNESLEKAELAKLHCADPLPRNISVARLLLDRALTLAHVAATTELHREHLPYCLLAYETAASLLNLLPALPGRPLYEAITGRISALRTAGF